MWNWGVPKIAHNTIIGDWDVGGFRVKHIELFLESLKIKFLQKLDFNNPTSWMLLPIKWITEHFNCSKTYDILSCKFEMTGEFRGPIFYIQALKTWETLVNTQPQDIYELYCPLTKKNDT